MISKAASLLGLVLTTVLVVSVAAQVSYFAPHPTGSPAPFAGREGVQLSSCGSDLLVLSGGSLPTTPTTYLNEIWYMNGTQGAETWSQVTSVVAPWSVRTGHRQLVLPNLSMLVAGGRFENTYYNDIYINSHCADGSWSRLTDGPFSGRINSQMQWWLNQVVWFGGFDGTNLYNDVWTMQYDATTGLVADTWVRQPDAQWQPRNSFASIVFSNVMYVMDGDGGNGQFLNDMWYALSPAGPWNQLMAAAPWQPRRGALLWNLNNQLIFGTGLGPNNVYYNDVWVFQRTTPTSIDGAWTLLTDHDAYSPRQGGRKANYRGRAIMYGGNAPDGTRLTDVWWGPTTPVIIAHSSSTGSNSSDVQMSSTGSATPPVIASSSTGLSDVSVSSTGGDVSITTSSTGATNTISSTGSGQPVSESSTGAPQYTSTGTGLPKSCYKSNGEIKKHCLPHSQKSHARPHLQRLPRHRNQW